MKKFLYIFFGVLLMFNTALAQNDEMTTAQEISKMTNMPSDEEIRATIQKFNFSPQEQEQLFKETKKTIELMYSQNAQGANILPEVQQSDNPIGDVTEPNEGVTGPGASSPVKKYSAHPPLTRRSK